MAASSKKTAAKKPAAKQAASAPAEAKTEAPAPDPVEVSTPASEHDRVAMLSVKADGTPDQNSPEFVGEPEDAAAATREQFRQQAVSAVDAPKRAELGLGPADEDADTSDAKIDALKEAHDAAAAEGEQRADSVVEALTGGK